LLSSSSVDYFYFLFLLIPIIDIISCFFFFFFNDTETTEIYTLSLHDALPICPPRDNVRTIATPQAYASSVPRTRNRDRKSTRLNSSHANISYAVFCLKKK